MKVLWFANTPCGASQKLGSSNVRGGWLSSLEKSLVSSGKVELGVCFYHDVPMEPFVYNNVQYFPIETYKGNSKWQRLKNRLQNKIESTENIPSFLRVVESFSPDVIHVHGTENAFGLIITKVDIPVIVSIQGNLTVYTHFYFRGLSEQVAKKYDSIKNKFFALGPLNAFKKMDKMAIREREIMSKTKYVFGRTDWDRSICNVLSPNASYFHSDELLRDSFYLNQWNPKSLEDNILFTTSGSSWFKGFETVVATALLLKSANLPFLWKVAGISTNDEIVKICEDKYNVKLEQIGIELLGKRKEEELVNDLISSSIFVQTSRIENSPNSLCEAMILGMPFIASTAGGSHSLFTHNHEGVLIQDGDTYAFAGTIIHFFNHKKLAITLGENARARALKRHDHNRVVNNLITNYRSVVDVIC